jgi:hypothetical protein
VEVKVCSLYILALNGDNFERLVSVLVLFSSHTRYRDTRRIADDTATVCLVTVLLRVNIPSVQNIETFLFSSYTSTLLAVSLYVVRRGSSKLFVWVSVWVCQVVCVGQRWWSLIVRPCHWRK